MHRFVTVGGQRERSITSKMGVVTSSGFALDEAVFPFKNWVSLLIRLFSRVVNGFSHSSRVTCKFTG